MAESRRVLLTGCASGIGLDLARRLAGDGHRVLATDLELAKLEDAAARWAGDNVELRALDVRKPDAWQAAIEVIDERWNGIDTLVNVAGVLAPQWVHELTTSAVDLQIDVNLKGVIFGMQAVTPKLVKQRHGHVINVASLAALAPVDGLAIYCATKYAVRGFSLAAATELKTHGVDVSLICPDAVRTPMLDLQRDRPEAEMTFSGPRELEPGDVTDAIVDAMRTRPLEVYLPRSRGWLARFGDVFPASARALSPLLRKRGRAKQRG